MIEAIWRWISNIKTLNFILVKIILIRLILTRTYIPEHRLKIHTVMTNSCWLRNEYWVYNVQGLCHKQARLNSPTHTNTQKGWKTVSLNHTEVHTSTCTFIVYRQEMIHKDCMALFQWKWTELKENKTSAVAQLECSLRKPKVGFSNSSRDRPKSLKQEVSAPLPNSRHVRVSRDLGDDHY